MINPEQAQSVVTIFEMYREGLSLLEIAKRLNDQGLPPPRAGSRKRASPFWRKTTLREMLSNRAYIGGWSYGRKHWRKDPTTRKRRYTKRAEHDVFTAERPHLRIIPQPLWDAVEARRKAVYDNYSGKTDGAPGRRTAHPFAGLLYCGLCGHRMSDGGGTSSRYYRCSGVMTGGICTNRQPVREDALLEAAVSEMKRILFATDLGKKMRERIEHRLRTFKVENSQERRQVERELHRVEAEIKRLVSFIQTTDVTTTPGIIDAIRAPLDEATRKQRTLKSKLDTLARETTSEPRAPTVEEIVELVRDVEARLKDDPTTAREALRQMLIDGRITMSPNPDGSYNAESMLVFGRIAWRTRKPRSAVAAGASSDSSVVGIDGCAGAL